MKKIYWLCLFFIVPAICFAQSEEGFYKKSETKVSFKGIGEYIEKREVNSTADLKFENTDSDFKGKDFVTNIATNILIKEGKNGVRIDLPNLEVANINHKKKEYTISKIKPITDYFGASDSTVSPPSGEGEEQTESPKDTTVKIIRQRFEVNKLDGSKKIGKFQCDNGYEILWVTVWEVVATGERGKDSLRTETWNTTPTDELRKAQEIEMAFSSAHLKALGINIDQQVNNLLGLDWGKLFGALNKKPSAERAPNEDVLKNISEMEGYPIFIKGGIWNERSRNKTQDNAEHTASASGSTDYSDPTGAATDAAASAAGGFLKKKLFGGKKEDPNAPNIGWETKSKEFELRNYKEKDLAINSKYKRVDND